MNEKVAKRRDALINLTYAAVIFGLLFLFFRYCFWVAAPFLLTFLFAVINQRPCAGWTKRHTTSATACGACFWFSLPFSLSWFRWVC